MMSEANYAVKYPMTARVIQIDGGKWGWEILRGKKPIAKSVIQSQVRSHARTSLERILFAMRHNSRPVKIVEE